MAYSLRSFIFSVDKDWAIVVAGEPCCAWLVHIYIYKYKYIYIYIYIGVITRYIHL